MWNSDETKSESEEGREQEGKEGREENEVKGRVGEDSRSKKIEIRMSSFPARWTDRPTS